MLSRFCPQLSMNMYGQFLMTGRGQAWLMGVIQIDLFKPGNLGHHAHTPGLTLPMMLI